MVAYDEMLGNNRFPLGGRVTGEDYGEFYILTVHQSPDWRFLLIASAWAALIAMPLLTHHWEVSVGIILGGVLYSLISALIRKFL
jgi:hypothetical protein